MKKITLILIKRLIKLKNFNRHTHITRLFPSRISLVGVAVLSFFAGGAALVSAQSLNLSMSAGDSAQVTCAGPMLSITNQTANSLSLNCAPNPTPTSTITPTPTPASSGVVSIDQTAKVFGTGTVSVSVPNATAEIAVAWVSADDSSIGQTVVVSGGGLTWHLAGRSNTQNGDAEAWWATTTGTTFTTSATPAQGGKSTQLTVITYKGGSSIGTVQAAAAANGAPTITLTPQSTGSIVGAVGMDFDNAINRTIGSNQTMDAQNTDSAGDTYWLQHANATTTSGTNITLNDTAPTKDRWDMLAVEVVPGSTISNPTPSPTITPTAGPTPFPGNSPTIDPSSPAVTAVQNNVTSVTTAGFSPPAGTVVYAVFSMDSLPGSGMTVSNVTNSGSSLNWNLLGRENHTDGTSVGGFVEVWWAYNATSQSNMTVTANFSQPTKNVTPPVGAFQILVMDNAAINQASAAWIPTWNVNSLSAPSGTVTTTANNSQVFAIFDNWDSSVSPTLGNNQTLQSIVLNPTDRDTYWLQLESANTAIPSTVTMNDTAPNNIHWHQITWEVLAAN